MPFERPLPLCGVFGVLPRGPMRRDVRAGALLEGHKARRMDALLLQIFVPRFNGINSKAAEAPTLLGPPTGIGERYLLCTTQAHVATSPVQHEAKYPRSAAVSVHL